MTPKAMESGNLIPDSKARSRYRAARKVVLTAAFSVAVLGMAAGVASASQISLAGGGFLAVRSGSNLGAGFLYNLSPSQGEIDALMTFDLSPYSGDIISNVTLTLTDAGLCCNSGNPANLDTSLSTSLSIYSLSHPYNPTSATLANVSYSSATLLDTESYDITASFAQVPVTFTISPALLETWADDPSSNDGFIVVESATYTTTGSGHSDIDYITSGTSAPVLSFDASSGAPEPASTALLGGALLGLGFLGRRKARARK